MSTRSRVLWFGGATLLVLAGAIVAAATHGITGEAVAISLGSLGLITLVSLVFFEVGLSEDREREAQQRRRTPGPPAAQQPPPRLRRPRRRRRPY